MASKPLMLYEVDDSGQTTQEIAAIKQKVESHGGRMWPVADLADIPSTIRKARRGEIEIDFEISSVDLIGHGSPGELSVGKSVRLATGFGTSDVAISASDSRGTRYHVLNSDPHAYTDLGSLVNMDPRLLSDDVPLRLIGCNTLSHGGPSSPLEYREIDGRVLLFALANMLLCKVEATTDFINSSHFDSEFRGQCRGFGTRDVLPVMEDTAAPGDGTELSPLRMRVPPIGLEAFARDAERLNAPPSASCRDIDISQGAMKAGATMHVSQDKLEAILAAYADPGVAYPEADSYLLAVESVLKLPNDDRLEILSRGRYLRWVRAGGGTVLFSVLDQAHRFRLVHAVHDAVGRLDGWMRMTP